MCVGVLLDVVWVMEFFGVGNEICEDVVYDIEILEVNFICKYDDDFIKVNVEFIVEMWVGFKVL